MITRRIDRSRMNDLCSEMQNCLTAVLMRSRMRWAGHMEWMTAGKLAKKLTHKTTRDTEEGEGRSRGGRVVWGDVNRPGTTSDGARRLWRE